MQHLLTDAAGAVLEDNYAGQAWQMKSTMTEIEGYTDLQIIGRGGFAIVYEATQVSIGRKVAIKLLSDPAPDDDLVRRFSRESRAVGALSWHPHIAAVVDAGATAMGHAYIVFELLSGGSLEERIEHAPMPWTEAVAAMIQVADAVEAAHRSDVLHRDIKPANILLDRLGVAKLGDFGIASMQDGNKTATGMLATTVAHAAPELFDGKPASEQTDIYALGSTLYTLLDGEPPFAPAPGDRISTTIARIMRNPPPSTTSVEAPPQLLSVITHALAKQPQYRLRSAAAFGQALQRAQKELGVRVTSMPVTDAQPMRNPERVPAPEPVAAPEPMAAPEPVAPAPPQPDSQPDAPAQPRTDAAGQPGTAASPAEAAPSPVEPVAQQTGPIPAAQTSPASPQAMPASEPKPYSRLIMGLSIVAAVLAATLGGLVLFSGGDDPLTTAGGARILSHAALASTEIVGLSGDNAVDQDATTYWGIAPGADGTPIRGSSYLIQLDGQQTIVRVGISNGQSTDLGRVSGLLWATSFEELDASNNGPGRVVQDVPNLPDEHFVTFQATTDRLVVAISGVHDDAVRAGIAEILIEVE